MKKVTLFHGIAFGFLISFSAAALVTALAPVLGAGTSLRLAVGAAAVVYLGWLLSRRKRRAGAVTALAFWLTAAAVLWFAGVSLTTYIVAHVGLIWLIRSFCVYRGVLPAVADLGLSGLALSAATWAAVETHSVALSFWSFFLVQSLFVAIPPTLRRARERGGNPAAERFRRAHRTAEAALRRIYSNQ